MQWYTDRCIPQGVEQCVWPFFIFYCVMGSHRNVSVDFISISGAWMLHVWPFFLIIFFWHGQAQKCFPYTSSPFLEHGCCMHGLFKNVITPWHGQPWKCFCRLYLHVWSMDAACMAFLKNLLPLDMGSHENVSVGFISISGAGMLHAWPF